MAGYLSPDPDSKFSFNAWFPHLEHAHQGGGHRPRGIPSDVTFMPDDPPRPMSWSNWPYFTVGLVCRGLSDAEIRKIIGGNFLRLAKQVLDKRPWVPSYPGAKATTGSPHSRGPGVVIRPSRVAGRWLRGAAAAPQSRRKNPFPPTMTWSKDSPFTSASRIAAFTCSARHTKSQSPCALRRTRTLNRRNLSTGKGPGYRHPVAPIVLAVRSPWTYFELRRSVGIDASKEFLVRIGHFVTSWRLSNFECIECAFPYAILALSVIRRSPRKGLPFVSTTR